MPSGIRIKRIEDRIQLELSELLIREINDPRLKQVYVTGVKVDRELAYANIYVSAVEGASRSAEVLEGLESASGFLRRTLSARVELRSFPKLKFHWDPTPENADHIEKLLAGLRDKK
ncbi:MAG: 30S ribosome-binding factor RbfA [Anaerolineales bacterium]|nr:30S ribosome-binding factor RbfA [Anaerolineales bacterium]MCB9109745.1 30S ribosome-binding factor RbfA [Anaerolineales bacterium]